jgi:site-specific recombinase XerD
MKTRFHLTRFMSHLSIEKAASDSTLYSYRKEVTRLISYLESIGTCNPENVSLSHIRQYLRLAKDKRNLSGNTVSKIIATIKSFFNYLEDEEAITKNPTRKINMPKKRSRIPRIISKYEFELLISSIDFSSSRYKDRLRDKLIFYLLFYTGIRRNELLSLYWSDLNLERSTLIIRNGKGKKDRIIPLHSNLKGLIDKYFESRLPLTDDALLVGQFGKRLSKASFVNIINYYLEASGLADKGYTAHSFRHSFATRLIESGVDIFKVQRLLGHASLDSTRIYINFNSSQMAKAVERL